MHESRWNHCEPWLKPAGTRTQSLPWCYTHKYHEALNCSSDLDAVDCRVPRSGVRRLCRAGRVKQNPNAGVRKQTRQWVLKNTSSPRTGKNSDDVKMLRIPWLTTLRVSCMLRVWNLLPEVPFFWGNRSGSSETVTLCPKWSAGITQRIQERVRISWRLLKHGNENNSIIKK